MPDAAPTPPMDLPSDTLIDLPDEAATARLGRVLAGLLQPGDTLLLQGPIGAGKSHLARSLIQHRLGRMEDVPSPTFTLVQTYDTGTCDIWHADLYRLSHPDEVLELGLVDAFATEICLVEWPDRLGDLTPENAITLRLEAWNDGRRAVIRGQTGAVTPSRLAQAMADTPA